MGMTRLVDRPGLQSRVNTCSRIVAVSLISLCGATLFIGGVLNLVHLVTNNAGIALAVILGFIFLVSALVWIAFESRPLEHPEST